MEKKQYMVSVPKEKREEFYNYIVNNYSLKQHFTKEEMINSPFPFVVDLKRKDFWICNSITCCAMASQNHKIIPLEEFITL